MLCFAQLHLNLPRAGLALKQLTDNEGVPHHASIRSNKRREKGKWLAETVKETMTSISMNEDLYDSDDEMPPPSALRRQGGALVRRLLGQFPVAASSCPCLTQSLALSALRR